MRSKDQVGLLFRNCRDHFFDRRRHKRRLRSVIDGSRLQHRASGRNAAHLEDLRPAEAEPAVTDHQAPLAGGEFTTKPIVFSGRKLVLNYSTSVAGGIWVELQSPDGKALDGFSLENCDEIFGDQIKREVTWKASDDVSRLSGKPIRIRFVLKDADLFSLRFQ